MVKTTKAQRKSLWRIFVRDFPSWQTPTSRQSADGIVKIPSIQYRRFRAKVQPYFDGSGCVMVPWRGMWLGIETDGHTHS